MARDTAKCSGRTAKRDSEPEQLIDLSITEAEIAVLIEAGKVIPTIWGDALPQRFQAGEIVNARCNLNIVTRFLCLSCFTMIPNAYHLGEHIKTSEYPVHVLAKWCSLHGAEAW